MAHASDPVAVHRMDIDALFVFSTSSLGFCLSGFLSGCVGLSFWSWFRSIVDVSLAMQTDHTVFFLLLFIAVGVFENIDCFFLSVAIFREMAMAWFYGA